MSCYHQFAVAHTLEVRLSVIAANQAAAEIDAHLPYGASTPRFVVPDIPKGPITLNNIKVDNSVVGAINTGRVTSIDVNISYLKEAGIEKVGHALKTLSETILNDPTISGEAKGQLIDQIAFLSEQASAAAKERRPGMIKAAFEALNSAAPLISALASAWTAAQPLLKSHFGMG